MDIPVKVKCPACGGAKDIRPKTPCPWCDREGVVSLDLEAAFHRLSKVICRIHKCNKAFPVLGDVAVPIVVPGAE